MESGVTSPSSARAQKPRKIEDVEQLIRMFEDSEEASYDARFLAERDRDYYDNKQWTEKEIAELAKRGQPPIVLNRIKAKVDFLCGLETQQRTDPKASPRNPQDEEAAQAATDALRYVEEKTRLDQVFSRGYEEFLIEGIEACEVYVKPTRKGPEICIRQVHFDRIFYDPHSREYDFSDARYIGLLAWVDLDEAEAMYPGNEDILSQDISRWRSMEYEDRPSWRHWVKGYKRPRVRLCQLYYRDVSGAWMHATFTRGGILEEGIVPYLDDEGAPECPLILQSCHVDRENNRYGVIRSLIGPQDEINKRRSKLLHSLSVRQVIAERGAVDDVDHARRQASRPDGFIEVNMGKRFEFAQTNDMAAGQAQLLAEAKGEIENIGPNASLQGKADGAPSGRAIIASQQGGIMELSNITDRHKDYKERVYRAIWNRIRQFWREEKWIRVTDNEDNIKFVGLNRKVTFGEQLKKQALAEGIPAQLVEQKLQAAMQDPQRGAQMREVVGQENVAADMDMDILIKEAPDSITIQQEQFEQLVQILPQLPPNDARFKILIEASSLRNKREILEKIDQAMQTNPQQAEAMEIEKQRLLAEVESKRAQALKTMAEMEKIDIEADGIRNVGMTPPPGPSPQPQVSSTGQPAF